MKKAQLGTYTVRQRLNKNNPKIPFEETPGNTWLLAATWCGLPTASTS